MSPVYLCAYDVARTLTAIFKRLSPKNQDLDSEEPRLHIITTLVISADPYNIPHDMTHSPLRRGPYCLRAVTGEFSDRP